MELSNAVLKNTANISHLYDTIQEIVIHKSSSTIIPALCLTFSGTRIFTPTKQYQPSAFTDQLLNWSPSQNYPKRGKKEKEGKNRFTPYYIKEFIEKMARIILLNINNLSVSLCKLRHFHCASCGYFIMQVEDFSIAV